MAEQKFPAGEVVGLRSGGPDMTVTRYALFAHERRELYLCRWFDGDGKLAHGKFLEEELELRPAPAGNVRLRRA